MTAYKTELLIAKGSRSRFAPGGSMTSLIVSNKGNNLS